MGAYELQDTIAAAATAPAASAIGIVRLSGPEAWRIARALCRDLPERIEPRRAYVAMLSFQLDTHSLIDTIVATCWQAPASYTGEDMAELSLHGNPALVRRVVQACIALGARPAEAGEFTYRAYLNGKLDLLQAEAVHELITAGSLQSLQLASAAIAGLPSIRLGGWIDLLRRMLAGIEVIHDYAADDLDASLDPMLLLTPKQLGEWLEELRAELAQALAESEQSAPARAGVTVAICGPPNAGKSTLFNALLGHERALTAPEPGTTRDYLTESVEQAGLRLTLVDTAGYRDAADAIEAAGVRRAGDWARSADIVLWVQAADLAPAPPPPELGGAPPVSVLTRCDLLAEWPRAAAVLCVSGLTGRGVPELWQYLVAKVAGIGEPQLDSFNQRQAGRIAEALNALDSAQAALDEGMPFDVVSLDLYLAVERLHGIIEQFDRNQVIAEIFSNFCVGK